MYTYYRISSTKHGVDDKQLLDEVSCVQLSASRQLRYLQIA